MAYQEKADGFLGEMTRSLHEHITTVYQVTYQGQSKPLLAWMKGNITEQRSPHQRPRHPQYRRIVCLAAHLLDQAPEYPVFSVYDHPRNPVTGRARCDRGIAGPGRTKQAGAVLDALELLDGDRLDTSRDPGMREIRSEYPLDQERRRPGFELRRAAGRRRWSRSSSSQQPGTGLEPEWLVVVLAAMVYAGDIVLALPGKKFDATGLSALAALSVDELAQFKHIEKPKEWNLPALKALFELLDIPPGNVQLVTQGTETPLRELLIVAAHVVERLVLSQQQLQTGVQFWGRNLLDDEQTSTLRKRLEETKTFLESLQAYSSTGKLKNFRYSVDEVIAHRAGLQVLREIELLQSLVADFRNHRVVSRDGGGDIAGEA